MTGTPEEIVGFLKGKRKVGITSHEKPDGDALGSSLALSRILRMNGFEVVLFDLAPLAPRYEFMLDEGELLPCTDFALIGIEALIVMDCGDLTRVGPFSRSIIDKFPIVNIDHHSSNSGFGEIDWIDPEASSAGEMVYELARCWGLVIPPSAAEPLWVAISTDTGDFTFSNTSSNVLRIAADLLDLGACPSHVRRNLQENLRYQELMMTKRCLEKLVITSDPRVAYISLTQDDFAEFNCGPQDLHEPIDMARSVKGVCIALLLYEVPADKRVKVSMRTYPPFDASVFCSHFGGGGHPRAAGCTINAESVSDVLPFILQKIDEIFLTTISIA